MKNKIWTLFFLFCSVGMFCSCGDDDNTANEEVGNVNQVSLSVIFPGEFATNRVSDAGYKLRCILEIYEKNNNQLIYRTETLVNPTASDGKVPLNFEIESGDYNCLMWADYVQADQQKTEAENTRYEDLFFDTSDLTAVSIKDPQSLVNNDFCDAFFFCGEIQKRNEEALSQEITLIRPLAKVSIREENRREFSLLKEVKVTVPVFTAFNVTTGTVIGEVQSLEHNETAFNPASMSECTVVSFCTFANAETQKIDRVNLVLTTGIQPVPVMNINIPENLIPLVRGHHVKVSAAMMVESPEPDVDFDIIYDINVGDWSVIDKNVIAVNGSVKVGDFFYQDGTYSAAYIKDASNPCIGVVFAVAEDGGKASADKPENYIANDGTKKLQKIHGWVVSAYDFRDGINDMNLQPRKDGITPPDELKGDANDIQGFMKTELLKKETLSDYPIAEIIVNYQNAGTTKAPDNTSGWYWAAAKQYAVLAEAYAKSEAGQLIESLAVRNSLKKLEEAGAGELFPENGNERRYWYSTATDKRNKGIWAGFACLGTGHKDYGGLEDDWWPVTNSGNARAILTF